ncbi:MAG TPA: ATP-binding SpoIIE family protein phosphatase [Acidobacteriaceae bacterium]|nr:ATP-binding SpoIIE family protein phosphatase [Acidobacteriaceae bacterium]
MPRLQKSVSITDRSSVGEARRAANAVALSMGFNEQKRSDLSIVVTELGNNVLMHASTGQILICPVEAGGTCLDIFAVDSGPGIRDVGMAFEDGVSTGGTAGQGLGAIKRLSDTLSLYSSPGRGTVVFCRFRLAASSGNIPAGVISIPIHSEVECGDSYLAIPGSHRSFYMVADGLGHGPSASEAARAAVKSVQGRVQENLTEIMNAAHNALKATRGAAMSIAVIDHSRSLVTYAGVGNVSAALGNGTVTRNMVSRNGTLGAMLPRVHEYTYPFEPGMVLLMYSDGLNSKCNLSGYPGIMSRPPGLIAGLLYRDFSRQRDDATVLVASLNGEGL